MVDIKQYSSLEKILELCKNIDIPGEVVEKVSGFIDTTGLSSAAPYFDGLFSRKTGADSVKAVEALYTDENGAAMYSGFGLMAVYLAAALHTREMYEAMGVDLSIYFDTMGFFRRTLDFNRLIDGEYTFLRTDWYYRQIACLICKLGELEYELYYPDSEILAKCWMGEGEPVLSVHIPPDAVLTREELDRSYSMAHSFFRKYHPDFDYKAIFCSTWLLAPEMKLFLRAGSRILVFQSDYDIKDVNYDADWYMSFMFKIAGKVEDYNILPVNTTLQRAAKKHLIGGGKIGWTTGLRRE